MSSLKLKILNIETRNDITESKKPITIMLIQFTRKLSPLEVAGVISIIETGLGK